MNAAPFVLLFVCKSQGKVGNEEHHHQILISSFVKKKKKKNSNLQESCST